MGKYLYGVSFDGPPTACQRVMLNPFKAGSQNYRLLEYLVKWGKISNREIVMALGIYNSTGRISEIRKLLKDFAVDIEARRIRGGLYEYRLVGM